ncbi:MAG: hypothetical protein PF569_02505 [Candidatus Woesearchaeota archaeon]|jgi:hypothetical protein|nr:hypothetical protein [Candidatus Woesearchaeota archaeon]
MKILKVIYNEKNTFILDIVNKFKDILIIETYNLDIAKERKKARPILTRFGTKNTPLIVFADENLKEFDAIWSEAKPNWLKSITDKLNRMYK